MIKSGRGRKNFRALRAQLYLQPHHTEIPRSAPAAVCRLSVIITKIARSRVLRIYVCCNYHELVGIGKKNWLLCASNWRIWLTSATNRAFFVQHACGLPTAPTPCAYLTRLRMLDLDAGKGHQVMKSIHLCTYTALQFSGVLQCWLYYTTMAEERVGYVL